MTPEVARSRFAADLLGLIDQDQRIGIAVSGGPDSLALLLLAAEAMPGRVEAATVDHRLREGSADEAEAVARVCATLSVPHQILTARWAEPPTANVQARARAERYVLLGAWASEAKLAAVVTAHHADDQAEGLLMRLARGAGVAGLGGTRARRALVEGVVLVRPLLGWRKAELGEVVAAAGMTPADDPSNRDPRHDRVRMREWLAEAEWADPARLAASAAWLGEADEALDWALARLVPERVVCEQIGGDGDAVTVDANDLPRELQRRLLLVAFARMGAAAPRGADLARAMAALERGETVTLAGLKLAARRRASGSKWLLTRAPARR